MKLAGRDAARYLAAPDPKGAGALLYGADASLVALRRAAVVLAMIGPEGSAEMRLTRLSGGDLRRDPAALTDGVKAIGFFPGPRLVLVEEAGDGLAPIFAAALEDWAPGDARILATAGALGASSALRKLFEKNPRVAAIGLYADPPGKAEITDTLAREGLREISPDALTDLEALARALEPGEFAQFLRLIALYKSGDPAPLDPAEVASLAPRAQDADLDTLLHHVAEGRATDLIREIRRIAGQGSATSLTIAAARHFRALHTAAISSDGPEAALARARPPVFGPRRNRMAAQARALGPDRLERALGWIVDAELHLRSARPVPAAALVERLFVRIAMLRRD
jgi:DNA polymerase-3 subunit delta